MKARSDTDDTAVRNVYMAKSFTLSIVDWFHVARYVGRPMMEGGRENGRASVRGKFLPIARPQGRF